MRNLALKWQHAWIIAFSRTRERPIIRLGWAGKFADLDNQEKRTLETFPARLGQWMRRDVEVAFPGKIRGQRSEIRDQRSELKDQLTDKDTRIPWRYPYRGRRRRSRWRRERSTRWFVLRTSGDFINVFVNGSDDTLRILEQWNIYDDVETYQKKVVLWSKRKMWRFSEFRYVSYWA